MDQLEYKGNNTDYFYIDKRDKELKFLVKYLL